MTQIENDLCGKENSLLTRARDIARSLGLAILPEKKSGNAEALVIYAIKRRIKPPALAIALEDQLRKRL